MGLVVLCAMSLVIAVVCHVAIRRSLLSVVLSSVLSPLVFQGVLFAKEGYLDPFFAIALPMSAALAAAVSVVVGIPFWARRRQGHPAAGRQSRGGAKAQREAVLEAQGGGKDEDGSRPDGP